MLTVINSSQCPYVTARVLVRAFNYDIASYTRASLLSFPVPWAQARGALDSVFTGSADDLQLDRSLSCVQYITHFLAPLPTCFRGRQS